MKYKTDNEMFNPELKNMDTKTILIFNLDKLHTTALGKERIQRNLYLGTVDVVNWCKQKIRDTNLSTFFRT
ncbi:MAG: DUF3781 domain-containing protein [Prevotellaceae bacterium]|jgi:hypothetical protein|nr:DUF3781 domain-containing protein [Prevotellaceae bacterium]